MKKPITPLLSFFLTVILVLQTLPLNVRTAAAEEAIGSDEPPVEEEGAFDIRVKTFPLKPMTAEEAILQMNLLGHAFYAFEDADSGDTCVVYKRSSGSYGLIIPEKKEV